MVKPEKLQDLFQVLLLPSLYLPPFGINYQNYHYLIIKNTKKKLNLTGFTRNYKHVKNAINKTKKGDRKNVLNQTVRKRGDAYAKKTV